MVRNILKIALRNLVKYRSFSVINITGLAGGLTCCLLILLFVVDEYSYDNFQEKRDRLYRVQYQINNLDIASIPPVMSDHIRSYFSEVEETSRLFNRAISIRIGDDARFEESNAFFTDSTLLKMLTFEVIQGQLSDALDRPYSIILNQTTAEKYFPGENPIGKQVAIEGDHLFQVSAVVADYPHNSHFHFDMLLPYQNMYDIEPEQLQNRIRQNYQMNWMVSHSHTYVLLKPDANPDNVNAKFPEFVAEKIPENMQRGQNFLLQPMPDFHLNNVVAGGPEPPGSQLMIYILIAVGVLTLLIACINFINLTTARFIQRAREIGIRKVLGARKKQLIAQFLSEAFVLTLVAAIASFFLAQLFLPLVNDLLDKQLTTQSLLEPRIVIAYVGLILITSVAAGIYPAFVVTQITPIQSLKGTLSSNSSSLTLRKALVVVQFSVSSLLVIGAMIVFSQLQYVNERSLGFDKDLMINVPVQSRNFNNLFGGIDGEKRSTMNAFEEALRSIPGVTGSTVSAGAPGSGVVNRNVIPDGYTADDRIIAPVFAVDYDFIDLYNISVVAGREFSTEYGTDHQQAFMINERAVQEYNLGETAEDALGKDVNVEGKEAKIIGVLGDFNYLPLTQEIGPLFMEIGVPSFNTYSIKIEAGNMSPTIEAIEGTWNDFFPEETFTYTFLDDNLAQNYIAEERLGTMIKYFSILAIVIAGLGSYGLVMFVVAHRMKEVGIRKVLGATVLEVLVLISKSFIGLVIMGFLIAVPFAWLSANLWLDNFSYRIDTPVVPFIVALGAGLTLVAITTAYHTFKAANTNPVTSLRDE